MAEAEQSPEENAPEVHIDRQKVVKGAAKSESPEENSKPSGEPSEGKKPVEPAGSGLITKLWNARSVFATLVLFSVGTVWLGIGISEKEVLGSTLGGIFLFVGFLAAVFTFVRKSA